MKRSSILRTSLMSLRSETLAIQESVLTTWFTELAQSLRNGSPTADAQPQAEATADEWLPTVNDVIASGDVAVIPLHGVVVKRSQIWSGWWSNHVIVGMDHWADVVDNLIARGDVSTIVLDCDTPGGTVAGTECLGDAIWRARQAGLTTIAVANELCCSAGLWIASQCERIVLPATATIGSLGVIRFHQDDTKFWTEMGVVNTAIHRGQYKARDSQPLTADGQSDLQRYIDEKYRLFVQAVARGRGLDEADVVRRWGDSTIYSGSEAVSSGLADEIGTLQDVLDSLRAGRGGRVSVVPSPADEEDPTMKVSVNAAGQILAADGKAVGAVSDLQLDAAALTKHFGAQCSELIDSAVNTAKQAAAESEAAAVAKSRDVLITQLEGLAAAVGPEKAIAALKAGKSIEAAKADHADELQKQLAERDAEIAKLKAGGNAGGQAGGKPAPKFLASDADGGQASGKPAGGSAIADKDAPFAADWEANRDGCQDQYPSLAVYAARRRYDERRAK